MRALCTSLAALTLLTAPVFAQSGDAIPSPNQRALQKPQSSDPAKTVPDSSSEGAASGAAGTAAPPEMFEPERDERANPDTRPDTRTKDQE